MLLKMKINQVDFDQLVEIGAITKHEYLENRFELFKQIQVESSKKNVNYSKDFISEICIDRVDIDILKKMNHRVDKSNSYIDGILVDDFFLSVRLFDNALIVISKHFSEIDFPELITKNEL